MKLNKTEKGFSGLNNIELYMPIDPKYMYAAENMANGRYTWNNSICDINTQPADYGLEHLMLQRQDLIFSKIDMLNSEIYERHQIKEANIYQINLDQCSFKNMIYAMGDHLWDVCLQKVLDKWGIKIGEGFRFPNTFYLSIKQPLKCNYTSFAAALCFS